MSKKIPQIHRNTSDALLYLAESSTNLGRRLANPTGITTHNELRNMEEMLLDILIQVRTFRKWNERKPADRKGQLA